MASGKSFLYPHSVIQMAISVAVFGYKVVYILFVRPYVDGLTDGIQGVLAVVSLFAVNINFFERNGITKKAPALSESLGILMLVVLGLTFVCILGVIVFFALRKDNEPSHVRTARLRREAAEAKAKEMELKATAMATANQPPALEISVDFLNEINQDIEGEPKTFFGMAWDSVAYVGSIFTGLFSSSAKAESDDSDDTTTEPEDKEEK